MYLTSSGTFPFAFVDASKRINLGTVLESGAEPKPWNQWNGECVKLREIVKQLAADYKAIHIPTQAIFDKACQDTEPSHWIWDGVHPLPQGHELIARSWVEAVANQLDP